ARGYQTRLINGVRDSWFNRLVTAVIGKQQTEGYSVRPPLCEGPCRLDGDNPARLKRIMCLSWRDPYLRNYPNRLRTHCDLGLRRLHRQIPHTDQVVGSRGKGEDPSHLEDSTMPNLPQQRDRLQPSEALFDTLPLPLTDGISRVLRRARVNRTPARPRSRFWATCGVTFKLRHSATKSAVS